MTIKQSPFSILVAVIQSPEFSLQSLEIDCQVVGVASTQFQFSQVSYLKSLSCICMDIDEVSNNAVS